jgi:hypothetical protein
MWPYWVMFLLPSLAALLTSRSEGSTGANLRPAGQALGWAPVWLLLTLLVGYRFQVGGDWGSYIRYLAMVGGLDFVEVLKKEEPAYKMLNWLSIQMDWGIFGVNLIGGAIFAFGLVAFCRRQPRPWLALAVAIPYLVIVVGMGYSRQGIALGLAMLGLVALGNRSTLKFVIWVSLAALFHKSAVLLLPISALVSTRNRYWTAAWVGLTGMILYYLLVANDVDALYTNYVVSNYQSEGAGVRLLMNALPALVLLIWRPKFRFTKSEGLLWTWFAIVSLVLLALFMEVPASTALDRVALYMLPLQLVVAARLPDLLGAKGKRYQPRIGARPSSHGSSSGPSPPTPDDVHDLRVDASEATDEGKDLLNRDGVGGVLRQLQHRHKLHGDVLPSNLRRRRREDTRPITGDHAKLPEFEHSATGKEATIVVVAILLYYGAVQFVWLNFAVNAHYWVPYRFYPLESSF